jgi:sulfur transfer complex TusBCD TusB component (DsrH family)
MAKYLFIESQDPYESADAPRLLDLARDVRAAGHDASLWLVQNGVLAARAGALHADRLRALATRDVRVFADRFSLRERGILQTVEGVGAVDVEEVVPHLLAFGVKAMWH